MKTVKENIENEIIINKSRFITLLIKINNLDEIEKNLKEIKKKYKDATHYCYAYIIGNKEKRLLIYDLFHLGYGNAKTLFKRLNMAGIEKKDILEKLNK